MFVGFGTVLNIVAIVGGGAIGVALGSKFKNELKELITQVLGCVTVISAADAIAAYWNDDLVNALPAGATMLVLIFSLLLGALVGSLLRIEDRLERFGNSLHNKFSVKIETDCGRQFIASNCNSTSSCFDCPRFCLKY
jgi:uncharacterized membrane protein YqgA involved in biofilm formation